MPIKIYLQQAAFSPVDIAGLKLWLKADTGVYKDAGITLAVEGESAQQWNDQSGNANNVTQATAAARPIYKINIINGQPAVRFDGSDDRMAASFALVQPTTVFIVGKKANTTQHGYFVDGITATGLILSDNNAVPVSSSVWRLYAGSGVETAITIDTSFHVFGGIANGASSLISVDGATTSGNAGASNANGITLGSIGSQDAAFLNGDLAEVVIYDSALSDANRNKVESYLGTKYGIAVT